MHLYKYETTIEFDKLYKEYTKNNTKIKQVTDQKVFLLVENPFSQSLRTHKVNSLNYGFRYSSRVNGDIRIIWDFFDDKKVIMALTIGGHSGRHKVYN